MLRFNYTKYGLSSRPIIPIVISYRNKSIEESVLIDSGADTCILDAGVATFLGIDHFSAPKQIIGGLGNAQYQSFTHPVKMAIGSHSFRVNANFIYGISKKHEYGILGQKGFFENFIVSFNLRNNEIKINPSKKKK
ncbi:MAG: hypothetical protein WCW03_02315 [Candidatus Paceibacterota bacterium]|jgi:hypothetical protein